MDKNKAMNYLEALVQAHKENPRLAEEYRNETRATATKMGGVKTAAESLLEITKKIMTGNKALSLFRGLHQGTA